MDRRIARGEQSRSALKAAFTEFFQTKEPEDITVLELCRKAGVNRSTFYAHFEYMDLLIREVLWDSVSKVCEGFSMQWDLPLEDGGAARDIIDIYLRRFLADPTLLRFCTCSNSGRYWALIVRAQVELSLGPTADPVRYYTACFHNAGAFACLLEWLNNGMPIPRDAVTGIIHDYSKVMYRSGT